MDLPGGDMSTERIEGLIEKMKGEADRRRYVSLSKLCGQRTRRAKLNT